MTHLSPLTITAWLVALMKLMLFKTTPSASTLNIPTSAILLAFKVMFLPGLPSIVIGFIIVTTFGSYSAPEYV